MKTKAVKIICLAMCFIFAFCPIFTLAAETDSYYIYDFNSYEDLDLGFTDATGEAFKTIANDAAIGGKGESDVYFRLMREGFSLGTLKFQTPMYKKEEAPLQTDDGCAIAVLSNKWFNVPWIWYYCDFEGFYTIVQTGFTDLLEKSKTEGLITYEDYCKKLNPAEPTAATPKEQYKEEYDSITRQKLTLGDGTQVEATVYKYNKKTLGFSRTAYKFIYKGRIYSILNMYGMDNDKFTDDVWKSFSVKEVQPSAVKWESDESSSDTEENSSSDVSSASEPFLSTNTKKAVAIIVTVFAVLLIGGAVFVAIQSRKNKKSGE
ncbi:MAG: hypothetical protein KBS52_03465 [Clostridiales bacterium]|nr:hypothetical protein [Candidatus Equinaster intestinalis]